MISVDIIILIFLLFGALIGFKRGFIKELVSVLGIVVVLVLSFILKDSVSIWFYKNLPFFKFGGILKGVTSLNILVYEVIAFLVVFSVLMIGEKILLSITGIIEKILDFTIILGLFSKILGALLGFLEYYIFIFIGLYIISMPFFHNNILNDTKYGKKIIEETPYLSGYIEKSVSIIDEFAALKEKYESETNANKFNYETLDLFLKYKVISVDNTRMLVEKDKLKIDRVEELLNKYKES